LTVENAAGSARIEVSAGTQQYDSGLMLVDGEPDSSKSFYLDGSIYVTKLNEKDGSIKLFMGSGTYRPTPRQQGCKYD
jgi:hypothetical protein